MSNWKIVFSPTGGTARAADILCGGLGEDWQLIDLMDQRVDGNEFTFTAEDVCVVAVPSFAGRVPETAAVRMAALKGNGARAVLLCAYGNRLYEDTLAEMQDLMEGAGFRCAAAVAAITEHSVVRSCATGRPDEDDRAVLADFARRIRDRLAGEELLSAVPGNRPYREAGRSHMRPYGTEGCISCGLCAARCPTGAIAEGDYTATDSEKCISCMACVVACPVGARELDKAMHAGITEKLTALCAQRKDNELFL